jgi:hypothetical protein
MQYPTLFPENNATKRFWSVIHLHSILVAAFVISTKDTKQIGISSNDDIFCGENERSLWDSG